ncbi:thymidine kinase [Patescibacteria group bacterium]|nr:thymidine kinase [Patescibacteria group bacterium]
MKQRAGYLEVIVGPMFSGKTEELIRRIRRAQIGKKRVVVFKHALDRRYGTDKKLVSHNGGSIDSELVKDASQIRERVTKRIDVVAIDEAQWFGPALVGVIESLLTQGKTVMISALALTFDRQPFEPIPTLMAQADRVTKLTAICSVCGEEAIFHKRMKKSTVDDPTDPDPSLVGKVREYEARCRKCWDR